MEVLKKIMKKRRETNIYTCMHGSSKYNHPILHCSPTKYAHLKVKSQVVAHNQWQMLISRLLYYQCQVPVPYFELTHDCVFVLQNLPSRQLRVMGL